MGELVLKWSGKEEVPVRVPESILSNTVVLTTCQLSRMLSISMLPWSVTEIA